MNESYETKGGHQQAKGGYHMMNEVAKGKRMSPKGDGNCRMVKLKFFSKDERIHQRVGLNRRRFSDDKGGCKGQDD